MPQHIATWVAITAIVGGVATLVLAVLAVGEVLRRWFKTVQASNQTQINQQIAQREEQHKMQIALFGEESQFPGGPNIPPLRTVVNEIQANTQGLPDRMTKIESRMAQVETAREQDRQLLVNHITEKHQ